MIDGEAVYLGSLDVARTGAFVRFNAVRTGLVTVRAVARSNATLGSWVAMVQRDDGGDFEDFTPAMSLSSSAMTAASLDVTGTGGIVVQTTTAGSSGFVDLYLVSKAVGGVAVGVVP